MAEGLDKPINMNVFAHGIRQILVELFDMENEPHLDQLEIGFVEQSRR